MPCGPDASGITLGAGPHIVQTTAGHNPPCASTPATCTGWNIDQLALDSAAGGGAGPAVFPTSAGTPQLAATQPGPSASVNADLVARRHARRRGDGRDAVVRARPRSEPQQGLAGSGAARARRSPGLAFRQPRAAASRRRLRQRMARRARPTCTASAAPASRSRCHVDPATGGVGRPGAVRRHPGLVPRARVPPPPRPAPGAGAAAPAAARAGGARRARTTGRALRRPAPGASLHAAAQGRAAPRLAPLPSGAAHRRRHGRRGRAGHAAAGRSRRGRRRDPRACWCRGPAPSPPWVRWRSSWPAASTSSRGSTCTTTCRAPTGPARSSTRAT